MSGILIQNEGPEFYRLCSQIMITFTDRDKSGNNVIPWSVLVVKGGLSEPVSQRVDTKCGVVDKQQSSSTSIEKTTSPITPSQSSDESGKEESHAKD
jgi:hypothetical protein